MKPCPSCELKPVSIMIREQCVYQEVGVGSCPFALPLIIAHLYLQKRGVASHIRIFPFTIVYSQTCPPMESMKFRSTQVLNPFPFLPSPSPSSQMEPHPPSMPAVTVDKHVVVVIALPYMDVLHHVVPLELTRACTYNGEVACSHTGTSKSGNS